MRICVCASFQAKQTALTFSAQICPKMDLDWQFKKLLSEEESASSIYHIPFSIYQFLVKMNNFEYFGPNLSIKDLGLKTEESNVGTKINIVETLCVPIISQTGQLSVFRSKFAKNGFRF